MTWDVEYTDEFGEWWELLTENQQDDITASAELLMENGPNLDSHIHRVSRVPNTVICVNYAFSPAVTR